MNGPHELKTHGYVRSVIVYDGIKKRGKEMKSIDIGYKNTGATHTDPENDKYLYDIQKQKELNHEVRR